VQRRPFEDFDAGFDDLPKIQANIDIPPKANRLFREKAGRTVVNFAGQANSAARKDLDSRGGVWKSLPKRLKPHAERARHNPLIRSSAFQPPRLHYSARDH
jgi:hypothetical protein